MPPAGRGEAPRPLRLVVRHNKMKTFTIIASALLVIILNSLGTMNTPTSWQSETPQALTKALYRSSTSIEDVDSKMWLYLCDLVPEDNRPYHIRVVEMLNSVSSKLRRYYLTRGFDWERGSGGLEACLMIDPKDDHLFLNDTIYAYESLGAFKHAAIIRELIPKSQDRRNLINEADKKGEEFNFDDGMWDSYETRWDTASEEFNFYDVLWSDILTNTEEYIHGENAEHAPPAGRGEAPRP